MQSITGNTVSYSWLVHEPASVAFGFGAKLPLPLSQPCLHLIDSVKSTNQFREMLDTVQKVHTQEHKHRSGQVLAWWRHLFNVSIVTNQ